MGRVHFKSVGTWVSRFARRMTLDRAGNIAIIFALSAIPLLTAVGGAVDFSRALLAKQRLGAAIDAAALAVGTMTEADEDELQAAAQAYFAANYPDDILGTPTAIEVTIDGDTVNIVAHAQLESTLLALIGIDTINVGADTQVTRESTALEIALVLDNTGSMAQSGKLGAMKTAAQSLVDIMFGSQTVHPKLKIAMVPFSQAVNVGADKANAFWIDSGALSPLHGQNFETVAGGPANIFTLYDGLTDKSWNGCVETRAEPYDMDDTTPTVGNPSTLWVPYFFPDEPGSRGDPNWGYSNSYLNDGTSGTSAYRQLQVEKYAGANAWGDGPHYGCYIAPITPLTNVKSEIEDAIDGMLANGYTHIPIGLAWGLRVVSPDEPFTEGVAYDNADVVKAIVLLTDGLNTYPAEGSISHNKSEYTAYGYVAKGRLGTTNYNTAVSKLDPKTTTVCNNVKAAGIRLYTITFQLADGPIKTLMRNCATAPGLYFDSPSNEELQTVFKAIAKDLSNLRISM